MNKQQILEFFTQKFYKNGITFILYLTNIDYFNIQLKCTTDTEILKTIFNNNSFFKNNPDLISDINFHGFSDGNALKILKNNYGHYTEEIAGYVELIINPAYLNILKNNNSLTIKFNNINESLTAHYFDEFSDILTVYDDNNIFNDFVSAGLCGIYISDNPKNIVKYTQNSIIKDWI